MAARDKWERRTRQGEKTMYERLTTQVIALSDVYKLYQACKRQGNLEKAGELKTLATESINDLERNVLLLSDSARYRLIRCHVWRLKYLFDPSDEQALEQAIAEVAAVLADGCAPEDAERATSISMSLSKLKHRSQFPHTT